MADRLPRPLHTTVANQPVLPTQWCKRSRFCWLGADEVRGGTGLYLCVAALHLMGARKGLFARRRGEAAAHQTHNGGKCGALSRGVDLPYLDEIIWGVYLLDTRQLAAARPFIYVGQCIYIIRYCIYK